MALPLEITTVQRRAVLVASVLGAFALGAVSWFTERTLDVDLDALMFGPVTAVAWACPRRLSLVFASCAAVLSTFICVMAMAYSPVQTTLDLVSHLGEYVPAALVTGILVTAMAWRTVRTSMG